MDRKNSIPPIVESSQGLARVDHNRLAEINSGIPKGKLYYELGLVKIQRPETESACLQGYRYARNPIGRPFTRGFQRCWDHPLKKDDLNQFLLLSLKKASCSRIQIPGQQIRSYNKLLQNRSSLISPKQVHSPTLDMRSSMTGSNSKNIFSVSNRGDTFDRDSRIEEDPTLILEPKTEFQAWLKGVSGQGVYPSELRTDPRGIEIYRNCIELADCEDHSISRILSGSKQILMDSFDAERYCSWLGGRLPGPGYALWLTCKALIRFREYGRVNWKGKTLLASYDSRNISLEPEFSGELGKVQCLWDTPQWNLEEALKNWTRQLMVRQQFDDALVYSRMLHITGYSRPRWPPPHRIRNLILN